MLPHSVMKSIIISNILFFKFLFFSLFFLTFCLFRIGWKQSYSYKQCRHFTLKQSCEKKGAKNFQIKMKNIYSLCKLLKSSYRFLEHIFQILILIIKFRKYNLRRKWQTVNYFSLTFKEIWSNGQSIYFFFKVLRIINYLQIAVR